MTMRSFDTTKSLLARDDRFHYMDVDTRNFMYYC